MGIIGAAFRGIGKLILMIAGGIRTLFTDAFDTIRYFRSYPVMLNITVLCEFAIFVLGLFQWVRGLAGFFLNGGYSEVTSSIGEKGLDGVVWTDSDPGFYESPFVMIVLVLAVTALVGIIANKANYTDTEGKSCGKGLITALVSYFVVLPLTLWLIRNILGLLVVLACAAVLFVIMIFTVSPGSDTGSESSSYGSYDSGRGSYGSSGSGGFSKSSGSSSKAAPAAQPAKKETIRPGDSIVLTCGWQPPTEIGHFIKAGTRGTLDHFSGLSGNAYVSFPGVNSWMSNDFFRANVRKA